MFRTRAAGSKGNRHSGALEAGLEGPCVQGFKCHLRGPWVSPKKRGLKGLEDLKERDDLENPDDLEN